MSNESGDSRDPKKRGVRWPLQQRRFLDDDDDTDAPNFDKGSWVSVILVLVLLGIGIALMLILASRG